MNESNERLTTADLVGRPGDSAESRSDLSAGERESMRREEQDGEMRDGPDMANSADRRSDMEGAGNGGTAGSAGERRPGMTDGADGRQTATNGSSRTAVADEDIQLVSPEDQKRFQERWSEIQINFVDEPKSSVEGADSLVADEPGNDR